MWKACCNILPTRQNVKRKNIVQEAFCPICELEEESIEHHPWECPWLMMFGVSVVR